MASKKIDPEKHYRIKLKRVVAAVEGRPLLHPRNDNVVKGKVLVTIEEFVDSYEEV